MNNDASVFIIRPAKPEDRDALLRVCLECGAEGGDATQEYPNDPDALGKRWVAPYLDIYGCVAFVLEETGGSGVCGYALAAVDTADFFCRFQTEYLPKLRLVHPDPEKEGIERSNWTKEQEVYHELHDESAGAAPARIAEEVASLYKSHLHIDIAPEAQGQGHGGKLLRRLFEALRRAGSPGVHLQMHESNARARHFYRKIGFQEIGPKMASDVISSGTGGDLFLGLRFQGEDPPATDYVPYVPRPTYGYSLLEAADLAPLRERAIVITQPEPWALVKKKFPSAATEPCEESPVRFHFVRDISHDGTSERCLQWSKSSIQPTAVFGIGGGMALDHAKFASAALGVPLVIVPSILSVDAGFTVAAGVRETDGKGKTSVVYVGNSRPEHLLIDYGLLKAAPPMLNSSGVGDLLSCFTAIWDWQQAQYRQGERCDYAIVAQTENLLKKLVRAESARKIAEQTEDGLQLLSELFAEEVRLCEIWGNSRCEEGSEHYVAYALEDLTGSHFLHGQLIALCVVIVGRYQGQDVQPIVDFLKELNLDCSFTAVGTTREELRQVLTSMGDFVRRETNLLPGVFHFKGSVPESEVDSLLDFVDEKFPEPLVCTVCGLDLALYAACSCCAAKSRR